MTGIQSVQIDVAADGRKIARVRFSPQVPNPASQSDVEVIFEVQKSDEVHMNGTPFGVIGPLSCTLVDTREPYVLTREQRQAVIQAVIVEAGDSDDL